MVAATTRAKVAAASAAAAEARIEALLGDGEILVPFTVPRDGKPVKVDVVVMNPLDWPYDAVEMLKQTDYAGWAAAVCTSGGAAMLRELRPTNREMLTFLANFREASGQDPAK